MSEKRLREIMDREIMLDFIDMTAPDTYEREELIKKLNASTNRVIYKYFRRTH